MTTQPTTLAITTDEQRSLAWSPEPPFESTGGSDCRPGGSCGLDFNHETRRGRWVQARYRWLKEHRSQIPIPMLLALCGAYSLAVLAGLGGCFWPAQ